MDNLTVDGKSIYELKVTELKDELGKRSLSKTGNKQQLVARLSEYLTENPEPASVAVPEKEKSPAKVDIVAQYLADRDASLAAALDRKRKVQAGEHKPEELQSTTEDTENTAMPVQSVESPRIPAPTPEEHTPERPITSPTPTGRKTRQQSRTTPSRTETASPGVEERENGGAPKMAALRSPTPELASPPALRSAAAVVPKELSPEVPTVVSHASPDRAVLAGSSGTSASVSSSVDDQGGLIGSDPLRVSKAAADARHDVKVPDTVVVHDHVPPEVPSVAAAASVPLNQAAAEATVKSGPKETVEEKAPAVAVEDKVAVAPVEEKVAVAAGAGRKVFEKKKRPESVSSAVPVLKEAEKKEEKVESAPPVVTETVVRDAEEKPKEKVSAVENVEPKSSPVGRKLTESISIEEEKLDYGDLEADDDVIMKDTSTTVVKPAQPETPTNRKRRQSITAPTGRSDSISIKPSLSEKISERGADENREIKEPPRKMARSGLGTVSDENKSAIVPEQSEGRSSPPPSKTGPTRMVHIRNLVRPYTVLALKELLKKTGTIIDDADHFWTDTIKSQCIACYTTEEEATATRKALYGIKWPSSSTKELTVDFIKEDEFKEKTTAPSTPTSTPTALDARRSLTTPRLHDNRSLDTKALENVKIILASNKDTGETHRDVALLRDLERRGAADRRGKERAERDKEKESDTHVQTKEETQLPPPLRNTVSSKEETGLEKGEAVKEREWDRGKEKEAEAKKEPSKPEERPKSPQEKNRLELLFERTETKPQLYWKRLTDAEISAREEKRRLGIFEERRPRQFDDFRPKAPERSRESPDRRLPRRDSPPPLGRRDRSPRSRERDFRGARSAGGGGGPMRRRPSPRRSSPYRRPRSRSPPRYRGGGGGMGRRSRGRSPPRGGGGRRRW
ncbi:apoptotic chromatin condensation inducer in the nucleus-like [Paramacrobiotus metropolitanus]|uniref:apoptotic chromatin condensation inducer in the nucleus-like n=1 Tax=Paramacrobiotus metropolitanus TaxID=2943436 RepID=UPI002446282E|nr:apoptotic chromatin condensation inducer in the nucleus-like [Paramacrobiotus metropolitanus]